MMTFLPSLRAMPKKPFQRPVLDVRQESLTASLIHRSRGCRQGSTWNEQKILPRAAANLLTKDRRIEDFTNELNSLRAKADAAHSPATPGSLGIAVDRKRSMSKTSPKVCPQTELGEAAMAATPWLNIDHSRETQSRSLELITLPPETILELLSHFERYYLPHLPILEPIESTSTLIEKSPLLFWTIIFTSCQWHPTLSYLYQQILAPQGRQCWHKLTRLSMADFFGQRHYCAQFCITQLNLSTLSTHF